jgi:hypothetical protein
VTTATLSWFDAAVRDDLGAVVGVGVAIGVCFLALAAGVVFLLVRYKRVKSTEDDLTYRDNA